MTTTHLAANIFLIPNGTFVVELVIFLIVLAVLGRYVAPAVGKALAERQEMVRRQAEESQLANEKLVAAEQRYAEALAEARGESARIRDEARAEGQQYLEQLRTEAQAEIAQLRQRAADELESQRVQAMRELDGHVAELSVTLAGRILGAELPADERSAATVNRYLGELQVEA